jgi:hypothetical protein
MKIQIDIDDLIKEFNFPRNTADFIVESTVEEITTEIYRNWRVEASNNLKSSRDEYINNLDIIRNSQFSRTIMLHGMLPNMIEKGIGPFDMKENFKKSGKVKYSVKTSKGGKVTFSWYLTIPFRIGTPGIVGENSAFSSIMPKEVHDIMKKKPANSPLKNVPSPFDIPQSRAAIVIPEANINFPEYTHKSSIYAGMVKKTGAYGKTTQNTYQTFRRVSGNSDPNSWIHKGIKAHNLMQKAVSNTDVNTIAENNVDKILKNLGYGQ